VVEIRIGFVSTWFERGAAYVTKAYLNLLREKHDIFVYARGGEKTGQGDKNWDLDYVTWGLRLPSTQISWNHFRKWVDTHRLDTIFFNEQTDMEVVLRLRSERPSIKIGSYVDYYKENTIQDFRYFDFLICNTKRHYSAFNWHPQCFYVPWGTDIYLFQPQKFAKKINHKPVFFHSMGMSKRKGTKDLIETFIEHKLGSRARLVIHTQIPLETFFEINSNELAKNNIEVIVKTVPAPGLYHLGDIYVYPTRLEGIGLSIYEALSCGLPVIGTDIPPVNEIVNNNIGKLIDVQSQVTRSDAYFWPQAIINKEALAKRMEYFIENISEIPAYKKRAREFAQKELNWNDRKETVQKIFENTAKIPIRKNDIQQEILRIKERRYKNLLKAIFAFAPSSLKASVFQKLQKRKLTQRRNSEFEFR
jgi:glycosyltransferase involved in cell wall biosynthesis